MFHWNFSVFTGIALISNSSPVFCTVAGKLACMLINPVVPGNGMPTSWLPERLRYQAALNMILFFKKPSSKAASSLVVFSQLKDGLYSLEGYREVLPP